VKVENKPSRAAHVLSKKQRMLFMLELNVTLDFVCCSCEENMSVTVRCVGNGLADENRGAAAVHVPCPTCTCINKVIFEPTGKVRRVMIHGSALRFLEPSLN
jgi:hypothetical protein